MVVAIAVEIHAAIIGGVVSGAVVLVGVVLADRLTRRHQLRDTLRQATTTYLSTMPLFMARNSGSGHAIDLTPQHVNQDLIGSLAAIEQAARRLLFMRHRREIRREVKRTMAQVQSIARREMTGGPPLTPDEMRGPDAAGARLNTLVLHGWQPTMQEVRWYETHGVSEAYPGSEDDVASA